MAYGFVVLWNLLSVLIMLIVLSMLIMEGVIIKGCALFISFFFTQALEVGLS